MLKNSVWYVLATAVAILAPAVLRAADLTPDEVYELLVMDVPMSDAHRQMYHELTTHPKKYYPYLIPLVDRSTSGHWDLVSHAVLFMAQKPVDPERLRCIRALVVRVRAVKKPATSEEHILLAAAQALGEIGDSSDAPTLVELFREPRPLPALGPKNWRRTILPALEDIGDEATAPQLEAAVSEMASRLTPEQIESDETIRDGLLVAARIRYRVLLERAEKRRECDVPRDRKEEKGACDKTE
jgi:hypothetical protein